MIKYLISLSLIGGLCASHTYAKPTETSYLESIFLNVGTHTEFYNNVQIDDSGGMRKFDFAPTLGLGASLPLTGAWRFLPEINWVLPRSAGSSQIIKNLLMFRADVSWDPLEWLRLRMGSSVMLLNQHGRGGSTRLSNGTGTSKFYYPDENHSSINNTFDLGVEAMYEAWSIRLQTYTYSLFKEERRQLSYTVFISYYWDM